MSEPVAKKLNIINRSLDFIILLLFICALAIGLLLYGINSYLESNRPKVLENISFLPGVQVNFGESYVTIFQDFPHASLILSDVTVIDSSYNRTQEPLLVIDQLSIRIEISDWRQQDLTLESLNVVGGHAQFIADAEGHYQMASMLNSLTQTKTTMAKVDTTALTLDATQIDLHIRDFDIQLYDTLRSTSIQLTIQELQSDLIREAESMRAEIDFDLLVDELIFSEANGSYLRNSRLKGKMNARLQDQELDISPFDLLINDKMYNLAAEVFTDGSGPIVLQLQSDRVLFRELRQLVTPKIATLLKPYEIVQPFPAESIITINRGDPVKVSVNFVLDDHDLLVNGAAFSNTKLSGRFINRRYDDQRTETDAKGHIRLRLQDITVDKAGFQLSSSEALITGDPIEKGRIKSLIHVEGDASAISEWYSSETFLFEQGAFVIQAVVDAPIDDVQNMIVQSSAMMHIEDLSVLHQPTDTSIPIHEINLVKEAGSTKFHILSRTLIQEHDYRIDGILQNFAGLLSDMVTEQPTSQVTFQAREMSWEDFVSIFSLSKKSTFKKTEKDTKTSMKETFQAIHQKFEPRLLVEIDSFHYFDWISLFDLRTGAYFITEDVLVLDSTSFKLDQGTVSMDVSLDISQPHETVFNLELHTQDIDLEELLPIFDYFNIQLLKDQQPLPRDFDLDITLTGTLDDEHGLIQKTAKGEITFQSEHHDQLLGKIIFQPNAQLTELESTIHLEGSPQLFNDFFQNDKFFFQDTGRFQVDFDYVGDLRSIDKLLEESVVNLKITDGAVYNVDVDIVFPLNDLEVIIDQDTADFDLYMYSDYLDRELLVTGDIENITELLFGNTGNQISTHVNISSPIINLSHAIDIFETPPDTSISVSENEIDTKMTILVKDMLNRFNPDLTIDLDSFIINERIQLTDLKTGLFMQDSAIINLTETSFRFYEGEVDLEAQLDITNIDTTAFYAHLELSAVELAKTLNAFHHFGSETLREADRLDGTVYTSLDISGRLVDLGLLEADTRAKLDFELYDLEVQGIDVIDQIAKKLFISRRLHKLKFAPLTNEITVTGSRIDIPQMEIQSTGFDLFMEGHIDQKNHTNVWLTIPLDNLKRIPTKIIPSKRGYANSARNIYVELSAEMGEKTRSKFRLSRRKFYKQRGILDQYKIDKKRDRMIRKKK